ncbi:MAG: HAMP domain-containing sensor histidine kinase [Bacteroidia bacterium]
MNSETKLQIDLEACRQRNSQLSSENDELVRSLFDVNDKLRDSEKLKGHFISNITNEIVNPFTSVIALAQNIKQLKEGEIAQAHRMAEMIYLEAFQLDFQLKNIFAAAQIEAGNEDMKRSSFRIDELGESLSHYFESLLNKRNIRLSVRFINNLNADLPVSFVSDKEKVDLILKNLISNSIKYSPENSVIELEFYMERGCLVMEISDHGKGIHEVDRKIVFDRFKQLDEKINSINTGHGLGLSIVQAYSEMLGGKVSLNDNPEGGLKIRISIPKGDEIVGWDDLEDFLLDSEASY